LARAGVVSTLIAAYVENPNDTLRVRVCSENFWAYFALDDKGRLHTFTTAAAWECL
jgi:hypothetical protein